MDKVDRLFLVRDERETIPAPDPGKILPHFSRCGFPLKKQPASYRKHERHDGDVKVTIAADPEFGMPFGADILTLLWCFTQAVNRQSRVIHFRAAADIMRGMRLPPDGRNYRAIVGSFQRIFGAKYTFEWCDVFPRKNGKLAKRRTVVQALLFDKLVLWFHDNEQQMPLEGEGFENEIVLSEFAWKWLHRTNWIETSPAYALRQTPGALQLYLLIAGRGPRLQRQEDFVDIPVTGPEGLDHQIGGVIYGGREGQKRWRQLLRKWLQEIELVWPDPLPKGKFPARLVKGEGGWYLRIGWFPAPAKVI